VHETTRVTLEVTFAFSSFEQEALERAVEVDFAGVRIPVAIPEDLVIYKALAWRDRDRSTSNSSSRYMEMISI
jgi:predicted nucleotidyltransferase